MEGGFRVLKASAVFVQGLGASRGFYSVQGLSEGAFRGSSLGIP